jgi:predicted NBD/HSP70 family sugar kinase
MGTVSLKELYDEAGNVPVLLENDMHAAGARWMLTHFASDQSDILLVGLDDGELGATMMIAGRSNRGCVTAANEIGHTRFFVDTERCYCGHLGCLERICSTDFLARRGVSDRLLDRVLRYDGDDPVLEEMVRFLAMGLANAVNFVRPNRLVLASRFTRFPKFSDLMVRSIRGLLLMELVDRVRIDLWDQPVASSAETAGWLALASLYIDSWTIRPV